MHTCPDDGTLRAQIDGDLSSGAPADTAGDCAACDARRTELRATRDVVAGALATLDRPTTTPATSEQALTRLQAARPDLAAPRRRRLTQLVASAAVVLLAAVVVGTPAGRSAAASALSMFRAERVTAVSVQADEVGPESFGSLTALDAVADVRGPETEPEPVADLAAAEEVAGFAPSQLDDAPAGTPTIVAAPTTTVEATLSRDRAPTLPAELDGAVLRVHVPGLVVQQWESGTTMELMIVEAGAPQVHLDGADLAVFRQWVLDDPGLPPEVADQLAALGDWRSTLPLPVPAEAQRDITVAGIDAVGVDYGFMRGAVWVDGDRVQGVAGTATLEELADIGAGLVR